ncbi:MAG TPA: ATP-dependent DNA ligase [Polyangiales bacterium]|nr:ATP-dependent DNA ligase [Polyangiales bacterium]
MRVFELATTSEQLAKTSKRTEKLKLIAGLLARADVSDRGLVSLYLSGSIAQNKLGVGYAQLGSLREHAGATEPTLEVSELDAVLSEVAAIRGAGSAGRRLELLRGLLGRATESEQRFIAKLIVGELRQGALESLVIDAIADAAKVPRPAVRRAQMLMSDLARVTDLAFERGENGLTEVGLQLFRPVQPMLADSAADVAEALGRLGRAVLEYKLDGARVQIHKRGDEVRIYTRTLNDVTSALPETVELARGLPANEVIFDGEVIAMRADGTPWPFQETMRRFGRKLDVEGLRSELPLSTFIFDCLYLEGRTLLDAPQSERVEILERIVPQASQVPRLVTDDVSRAEAFMRASLDSSHEGLMAKACDAVYAAGNRGSNWIKLKVAHTFDLVVLAAEWGSGRRSGWLSNLHLGARDPNGGFVMLGKTFKGLTDELLRWQTEAFLAREVRRDQYTVYVRPELVVEIAFNDIQRSPHYPGGLALRFARVKRYRDDKTAEQADTIDQVRAHYQRAVRETEDPEG